MKSVRMIAIPLGIGVLLVGLVSCGAGDISFLVSGEPRETAPALEMVIQDNYKADHQTSVLGTSSQNDFARQEVVDSEMEHAVGKYVENIESYNELGESLGGTDTSSTPDPWDEGTTYERPGTEVLYTDGDESGVFINKWWTKGDAPRFIPNYGPWEKAKQFKVTTNNEGVATKEVATVSDTVKGWSGTAPYKAGDLVRYTVDGGIVPATAGDLVRHNTGVQEYCFEAKYWTQDNEPILTGGNTGKADWESPWKISDKCDSAEPAVFDVATPVGGGKPAIEQPPSAENSQTDAESIKLPDNTPVVPLVIPAPPPAPEPAPAPPKVAVETVTSACANTDEGLPKAGYAFLRRVTCNDWDWMFSFRSGKYHPLGEKRNTDPNIAPRDGSKDTFTLDNFKKAVIEYNSWAVSKNYKQFLNEGTMKQQGQEFLAFWGKACRETSGSWSGSKYPWVESYTSPTTKETTTVWKGCLYWVEEVSYNTFSDGTSPVLNYIDAGSNFTPKPNRSYYGRGVVQLSWNYNYGAFSAWLYDNGLLKDIIETRDTLLWYPNYVADYGELSILSAIWFWMTPQGAKPSSHDVMYGEAYNMSKSSQDQGLPQRRDGATITAAAGDTTDEAVMAYRFGTVINIVNGGLECNGAAKWHSGPPQRVSYFNAFSLYFNAKIPELEATYLPSAMDIWKEKVTDESNSIIKDATCYSQKSYYGW